MKVTLTTAALLAALFMLVGQLPADEKAASTEQSVAQTLEDKIKTNLEKLSEGERKEVETQRYCPFMTTVRLGAKGTPIKILVDDKPVYVCCKGCEKAALKDTAVALKKTEQIKVAVAAVAELPAADQVLAEEQLFCAVATSNRLGSMGTPLKVMIKDQPVFLCCKGCQGRALSDPDKTLKALAELKAKVNPKQ